MNVSGERLSSTSLFIYWAPVPLQHRGGLILGYNVSLWTPGNDSSTNITLTTEREEIPIKGLDKFTPYLVTVSAFNEFGDGVFSDPIEIWTDEHGRWKTKRLRITFYPWGFSFLAIVVSPQSNVTQSLFGHWSLEVFITEWPHVIQSGFWNPEISPTESGIQTVFFLWNQESWSLESRIPLKIGNRNPVSGIQNPILSCMEVKQHLTEWLTQLAVKTTE